MPPEGAPDANEELLLAARVPRAAPRATRNQEMYIRKIGNRKKGKEEGSNTPMGQRPGEFPMSYIAFWEITLNI